MTYTWVLRATGGSSISKLSPSKYVACFSGFALFLQTIHLVFCVFYWQAELITIFCQPKIISGCRVKVEFGPRFEEEDYEAGIRLPMIENLVTSQLISLLHPRLKYRI